MPIKRSSGRLGPIGGGVNNNTRRACEQMVSSVPLVKHSTFPVVPKLSRIWLSRLLCYGPYHLYAVYSVCLFNSA
ncbi:unnamed protein product [Schistosoma curassoni]|uniref:Uncharacterized protein n=1 Tax=Schistosoma curassoni TaxID=6186 RepID=A0A183L0I0_9TREM|nr:unnamed protein product [Schistosoma curassoni]